MHHITGSGLSPLHGSTTIEQLDLSLVGLSQNPHLNPKPPISCEIVLPILDSIISNRALCKLKYLHFPKVWRVKALEMRESDLSTLQRLEAQLASEGVSTGSLTATDFHAFLVRYNQILEERGSVSCLKCNQEVTEHYHQPTVALENVYYNCCNYYGAQRNLCHQCSNYVCRSCPTENYNVDHYFCCACDREYCTKCVTMRACGICEEMFCSDSCLKHSCASPNCYVKLCGKCKVDSACIKCNRTWCVIACYRACPECEGCNKACCVECSKEDKANEVFYCHDCSDCYYCSTCLLNDALQEGSIDCQTCMKRVTPLILEQNKQLKDENKELKNANEELKNINEGLKQMQMNQSKLIQDLRGSKQNP